MDIYIYILFENHLCKQNVVFNIFSSKTIVLLALNFCLVHLIDIGVFFSPEKSPNYLGKH